MIDTDVVSAKGVGFSYGYKLWFKPSSLPKLGI
jgi:hypothetical protein